MTIGDATLGLVRRPQSAAILWYRRRAAPSLGALTERAGIVGLRRTEARMQRPVKLLTPEARHTLPTAFEAQFQRFLRDRPGSASDSISFHIPEIEVQALVAEDAMAHLGLERVQRLSLLTTRVARQIDVDICYTLVAPLGFALWWALKEELFVWPVKELQQIRPSSYGGFGAGFNPLMVALDWEALHRLDGDGWPRLRPIDAEFSMQPRPLWGRGGRVQVSPARTICVETAWVS